MTLFLFISDSFDICGDEEILKLRPEDSLCDR